MVELMILALANGLRDWGLTPVTATQMIAADAHSVRDTVSDPLCQWRLVAAVSPALRARAFAEPSPHPRMVHARVQFASRDALWMTWMITPGRGTTEVDLVAQLESRSTLVRVWMLLGGRRRLRRHLETTLGVLAGLAHRAAEDLDAVEPSPAPATPSHH
jgi:hypothetical protein